MNHFVPDHHYCVLSVKWFLLYTRPCPWLVVISDPIFHAKVLTYLYIYCRIYRRSAQEAQQAAGMLTSETGKFYAAIRVQR